MALFPRPVTKRILSTPESMASLTTYWTAGLSTIGSISFGWDLVTGNKRVPYPATGITAFDIGFSFIGHTPNQFFYSVNLLAGMINQALQKIHFLSFLSPGGRGLRWGGLCTFLNLYLKALSLDLNPGLSPSSWPSPIKGEGNKTMRHPENSLFESVRISSDTADVILSGAFPREDLIFLFFLLSFNSFFILPLTPSRSLPLCISCAHFF